MKQIAQFREENPQYKDISDSDLTTALHNKYYSTVDFNEFSSGFMGSNTETIDNTEDKGGMVAAFGSGVDKLQELGYRAVKGFTDVGGEGDGLIEQDGALANFAQQGIDRNIEEQKAYVPTVGTYKDALDSPGNAFSYASEMIAGSIPYMAAAMSGVGATVMAGGLSQEAYDAQPEDEKNALRALVSGTGQMALERVGIKSSFGSIGKSIMKDGFTNTAKKMSKGDLVKLAKDPATALAFSKRVLIGAAGEGSTEAGQEALAMWGAGKDLNEFKMLDSNKNNDDFLGSDGQRMMESFVGGAVVGGVIRTGSESAQKLMSWQKKSAPIAKNGIDELVKQGVTQEDAIEQVRGQLITSAMNQGLNEAEAAAAAARTMKTEYDIDHEIFTPIANDVASRRAAMNERLNQQRIDGGIGDVQNALNNNDVSPTSDELVQQQMKANDPEFFEQLDAKESTVAENATVQPETEVNKVTKTEEFLPDPRTEEQFNADQDNGVVSELSPTNLNISNVLSADIHSAIINKRTFGMLDGEGNVSEETINDIDDATFELDFLIEMNEKGRLKKHHINSSILFKALDLVSFKSVLESLENGSVGELLQNTKNNLDSSTSNAISHDTQAPMQATSQDNQVKPVTNNSTSSKADKERIKVSKMSPIERATYEVNNPKLVDELTGTGGTATENAVPIPPIQKQEAPIKKAKNKPIKAFHGTGSKFKVFDKNKSGTFTEAESASRGFFFTSDKGLANSFRAEAERKTVNIEGVRKELSSLSDEEVTRIHEAVGLEYILPIDPDDMAESVEDIIGHLEEDLETNSLEDRNGSADTLERLLKGDFFSNGETKEVDLQLDNPLIVSFNPDSELDEGAINKAIDQAEKLGNDGVIFRDMKDAALVDEKGNGAVVSDVYFVFEPEQITDNKAASQEVVSVSEPEKSIGKAAPIELKSQSKIKIEKIDADSWAEHLEEADGDIEKAKQDYNDSSLEVIEYGVNEVDSIDNPNQVALAANEIQKYIDAGVTGYDEIAVNRILRANKKLNKTQEPKASQDSEPSWKEWMGKDEKAQLSVTARAIEDLEERILLADEPFSKKKHQKELAERNEQREMLLSGMTIKEILKNKKPTETLDGETGVIQGIESTTKPVDESTTQPLAYGEGIERVEHIVKKNGKVLTGIIDNNLSRDEVKAIDPSSFRKGKLGWFIRENRIDEYNEKNSPTEVAKVEPVIEQQTQDTSTLSDHFLTLFQNDTAIPKNATQMKKLIAEFNGIPLKDVTKAMEKTAQESFEAATVKYAQAIAKTGNTKEVVDKLTSLYEQQPNLNMKSATSVKNMAYSTPAPISYLVNKVIGIDKNTTVFEPTAGNGLLLVNNNIDKTTVNELESIRLSNLKWLGYNKVTDKDATDKVVADKSQDVVIMNPPFGNYGQTVDFIGNDGYTYGLKDIDHIIAAKQLDAMKDNGNAALILGANKDAGLTKKGKTGVFLNWLYQNYNVVDHVELDGKVYSRQGAEWPIRIITIHGRNKAGQGKYAPVDGEVTRITGSNAKEIIGGLHERYSQNGLLDTKYGQSERATTSNDSIPVTSKQQDNGSVDTVGSDKQTSRPTTKPTKSRPDPVDRSVRNDNDKSNDGQDGDSGRVSDSSVGDNPTVKPDQGEPAGQGKSNANESPRDNGVQRKSNTQSILRDLASTSNDNSFQSNYVTGSKGFNEGVLIPVNMATKVQKALSNLIKKHGDLDEYVQDKLNYASGDDVKNAFMGLQVDGIAMAIDKIENKKAIVIADQTGVGKGRQAAAIVRYAIEQGKTPVFITQKANLFSDMYGDLKDIGSDNVVPFIFNDGESVTYQGKNHFKNGKGERKGGIESLSKGEMPGDSNALFLTYSQINSAGPQQSALTKIAKNAVFILDESHTGAGAESNTGKFLRDLLPQSSGALYLSATYAKRPDQLGLYRLTSLGDAAENMEQLQDAINNGGLQLQTLLSSMLSEEGELVRRERSFDGISVNTKVDKENSASHEKIYDEVVTHLQDILTLSRSFKNNVKVMNQQNSDRQLIANGTVDKMNPFSFSSVVHNYISQLTIAIKADSTAQAAIDAIKQGKKPVIALESTLESKLESYMKRYAVSVGDSADGFTFTDILNDALTNAISLSVKLPNGKTEKIQQSLSSLLPRTRMLYKQIQGKLDQSKIDLPISPIDYIRKKINDSGYSVEEVTGRSKMVDYSDNMKIVNKHQSENKANRRKVVDRFNAGKTDVLILNQSGSTGLSIHSSEKFQDKRPRHMIVAQPSLDINTFMQMLGRINRTGQVNKPSYDLLWLDLPSENRPAAVLSNKLKGLNANTSANTDSANNVESMDMFNSYGDMVVVEYLEENPGLLIRLGVGIPEYDIAQFITGKLAVLPVTKQREFFDEIEPRYNDYVNYLKSVGDYHLDTPETDLDARPLEQNILDKGKNTNTFTSDVKLTKVDAKSQGRSAGKAEAEEAYQKADASKGGKLVDQYTDEFNNYINKQYNDKIAELEQKEVTHKDPEKLAESQKANQKAIEIHTEKRNKNIAKMRSTADKIRRIYAEGKSILLSVNDEKIHGLIVNITHRYNGKGDPFSASNFKVKVMTASGLGTLNLSLNQVDSLADTSGNISISHLKNIFEVEHNKPQRETRHIITGNLVKAYTMIKGGNIVSFTKSGGGSDIGILMPKNFKAEKDIEKPTYVTKFTQLIKYLDSVDSTTQARGVRNSDEFGIGIIKGELTVSIPVNNAPIRAKYLSEDIEKILKEEVFWRKGQKVAYAKIDEKQGRALFNHVKSISPFSVKDFDAEKFNEVNALKDPSKAKLTKGIRFSADTSIRVAPNKVTLAQVQKIATDFKAEYNGNIPLEFKVVEKQEQLYGPQYTVEKEGLIKGGYHPESEILGIASISQSSVQDTRETLRHEILGHYGLNTFKPNDKKAILQRIINSKGNPALKKVWVDAEKNYSNLDQMGQAEEVFAAIAENPPVKTGFWGGLVVMLRKAMRALGIFEGKISKGEVESYIKSIAKGIKSGKAKQQTFPKSDQDQFRREGGGINAPDETRKDAFVRKIQDKLIRLKVIQRKLNVTEANNAYVAEEAFHGKVSEDLRKMGKKFTDKIADLMAKHELSQDEVDLYLIAKHAQERNAYIDTINPELNGTGSGMSNEAAQAILDKAVMEGKRLQLEEIANKTYSMLNYARETMVEYGLEAQGSIDSWQEQYQYYVPLKGYSVDDGKLNDKGKKFGTGKGFNIKGRETIKAMGRRSLAESPLLHAISDTTQSIIRARKNEVGNVFLKLVNENPDRDFWEVFTAERPDSKKGFKLVDGIKTVTQIPMTAFEMKASDDYYKTKVDGEERFIKIEDPLLLRAMGNLGVDEVNIVTASLGKFTRLLSALVTAWNPEFMLTNASRDIQAAISMVLTETQVADGKALNTEGLAFKMVKSIPKALVVLKHGFRNDKFTDEEWGPYLTEFLNSGAKTGWVNQQDIEGLGKELKNTIAMASNTTIGKARKTGKAIADFVYDYNDIVENGARFSTYYHARKQGVSIKQASSLAKNLTINFNRKGEIGNTLNAFYMFANASVQGTANMMRAIATPKDRSKSMWNPDFYNTSQKLAVAAVGTTVVMANLMRMIGGDDDDGIPLYDKIEDHIKATNFVMLTGGKDENGDVNYIAFPMPYGYNIFAAMGHAIDGATQGKSIAGQAGHLLLSAASAFSPIGMQESESVAKGLLKTASPTFLKPIAELAVNENFFGGNIYPEQRGYGATKADAHLGNAYTWEWTKGLTTWLNDNTGGTTFKSGKIDIAPQSIDHMVKFMGGGVLQFAARWQNLAIKASNGEEVKPGDIPFARRFYKQLRPKAIIGSFYDDKDILNDYAADLKSLHGPEKAAYYKANKAQLQLANYGNGIEKALRLLNAKKRATESSSLSKEDKAEKIRLIDDRKIELTMRFSKKKQELGLKNL